MCKAKGKEVKMASHKKGKGKAHSVFILAMKTQRQLTITKKKDYSLNVFFSLWIQIGESFYFVIYFK